MKAQDLYDFLQEPLSIEIDAMRDIEHTQSILIELESFNVEFDVYVVTGSGNYFGCSGVISSEMLNLEVSNEDCNVSSVALDLIHIKVVGAVMELV